MNEGDASLITKYNYSIPCIKTYGSLKKPDIGSLEFSQMLSYQGNDDPFGYMYQINIMVMSQ